MDELFLRAETHSNQKADENVLTGFKFDGSKKPTWYEGSFYPPVGTSMFIEVDPKLETLQILGLNEQSFFLMNRKFQGS